MMLYRFSQIHPINGNKHAAQFQYFLSIILFCFFTTFPSELIHSQKNDHVWLVGRDGDTNNPQDSTRGISVINFNTDSLYPEIYFDGRFRIDFDFTGASISDSSGSFIFAYNGRYVESANGTTMENALILNPTGIAHFGDVLINGGIVIPNPGNSDLYNLFHQSYKFESSGSYIDVLLMSVIDMTKNNGLGAVTIRSDSIINGRMDKGKMSATRHANGRDWWLLVPKHFTNEFYTLLISTEGVDTIFLQEVGMVRPPHLGQAVFSPDGSHMAIMNLDELFRMRPSYLDVFDFDPCTGLLSNHLRRNLDLEASFVAGAAFSPSGKYLYVSRTDTIYQVDMTLDSLQLNPVAVFNYEISDCNLAYPWFGMMQLGPDGRIYIASNNSLVCEMHVIQLPDRQGTGCEVRQLAVKTPTLHLALPQLPHYRTGPLDGSACDTLGIDNMPKALFRADIEHTDRHVVFTNASYYEPHTWYWDFGDGNSNDEQHPEYSYAAPGIYEVCLTASNDNGTDTWCRNIDLSTTSDTEQIIPKAKVTVQPNPAKDHVWLLVRDFFPANAHIRVYDIQGRILLLDQIKGQFSKLDVSALPSGVYFWQVWEREYMLGFGKMLKF